MTEARPCRFCGEEFEALAQGESMERATPMFEHVEREHLDDLSEWLSQRGSDRQGERADLVDEPGQSGDRPTDDARETGQDRDGSAPVGRDADDWRRTWRASTGLPPGAGESEPRDGGQRRLVGGAWG